MPSLSAILPNYNYANFFSSRLQEVLSQTYPVSELIILDDASTDNSVEIINQELKSLKLTHPEIQIKTAFNSKNSGSVFSQWEKGIKLASGDYIWIAELDDSCSPKLLETLVQPIQTLSPKTPKSATNTHKNQDSSQTIVLSYANSKLIGAVSVKDHLRQAKDFFRRHHLSGPYVVDGPTELNKNLAVYNSIPNVSACIFKNLPELPKILQKAKKYHLSGDWYFYSQLALLGQIAYTPQKLNFHRLSPKSVTNTTTLNTRFSELQEIHQEIISSSAQAGTPLSQNTLSRIQKSEQKLQKAWHLV